MSIKAAIKKNKMDVFRRLYIKRRIAGEYEADWERIDNKYIINFGSVTYAIDDIKVNFIKFSGMKFTVDNSAGKFSNINENKSLFYGATSIYKTMVKLEAGYDYNDVEYPTSTTLYIGLIGEDYKYPESSRVQFSTKHLSSIFDEFPADQLTNMNVTLTASEIITKIRDHEDSSNTAIFQKYITTAAWHFSTTTNPYLFATNSALEGMTCWELLKNLAEAENKVCYISTDGEFYFYPKTTTDSVATYHLSGVNDDDRTWGHNIISNVEVDPAIRKIYNRVRAKHDEADTSSSYYIKKESWNWNDSTSSFIYGVRTYDFENIWMNSATAQTIADSLFDEYHFPKNEISVKVKFVPQLFINDRVSMTYRTQDIQGDYLWGYFDWGAGVWGEAKGYNIDIDNQDYRIISMKHNINKFSTDLILREI